MQTEEHRGVVYHVIGTVNNGAMQYETKPTHIHPFKSITFVSMHELGRGASHDLQRMDEGCWDNCAPAMRLCDDELLYPGVPLRRCQKWAAEAIELLQKAGVVVSGVTAPCMAGRCLSSAEVAQGMTNSSTLLFIC